jgi:hypothetical protein
MHAQFGTFTLRNFAIKLRWSNDGQLGVRIFECIKMSVCKWMKLSDSWVCRYQYCCRNCNYMVNNLVKHNKFCFESTLSQHANNIVANANKSLGFLKRNLKTSNRNIKSQAYLSLVCMHAQFGTLILRNIAIKLR